MNPNEQAYKRTVSAIGGALLIFLLLVDLYGVAITLLIPLIMEQFMDPNTVMFEVIYQLLYGAGYLFSFMMPVLFMKLFFKRAGRPSNPMYSAPRVSPYLPLILCFGVALIFTTANINAYFMELVGYYDSSLIESMYATPEPTLHGIILEFIVMCLVPGFCEEFLFRGAILTNCLPFGRTNAIVISSLLFALMHRNGGQILYAFAAGILLGLVYERTGSIWNCVILHTVNNFVSSVQSTLLWNVKDALLSGVWYTVIETVIYFLGVISGGILLFRLFLQKKEDHAGGFFGKELPAYDGYAEIPISGKRAVKLFFTPTMVIFLALCTLQIGGLILLAAVIP